MNNTIGELEECVSDLNIRLGEVTTCSEIDSVDNKESGDLVPLAEFIKKERKRIVTLNFYIRELINRIQI